MNTKALLTAFSLALTSVGFAAGEPAKAIKEALIDGTGVNLDRRIPERPARGVVDRLPPIPEDPEYMIGEKAKAGVAAEVRTAETEIQTGLDEGLTLEGMDGLTLGTSKE